MKLRKEIDSEGTVRYYNEKRELHREGGPAVEWADGDREWYLEGKEYAEEEYWKARESTMQTEPNETLKMQISLAKELYRTSSGSALELLAHILHV